jgi:hypothetical protein
MRQKERSHRSQRPRRITSPATGPTNTPPSALSGLGSGPDDAGVNTVSNSFNPVHFLFVVALARY